MKVPSISFSMSPTKSMTISSVTSSKVEEKKFSHNLPDCQEMLFHICQSLHRIKCYLMAAWRWKKVLFLFTSICSQYCSVPPEFRFENILQICEKNVRTCLILKKKKQKKAWWNFILVHSTNKSETSPSIVH